MKSIDVGHGKQLLIDDEDVELVTQYRWFWNPRNRTRGYGYIYGYKIGFSSTIRNVSIHRFITKCPKGMVVDHLNGDTLDNRRCNLRICTPWENRCNTHYKKRSLKGAYWEKDRQKWISRITVHRKVIHLGRYATQEEAAHAYDRAAKKFFGEYAKCNDISHVDNI